MLHRHRDSTVVKSRLSMIIVFLGVVSRTPGRISCGGVGVDVIKTLERCPNGKVGVHYPFDFKHLHVENL